nr:DUF805 domain-containing protein [Amylibacter sp.]
MDFATAVKTVFSKYVDFSGRATRPEFWWWVLFVFVASLILTTIDTILGLTLFSPLFSLATLLPGLAVSARRLHDINRSGWWQLIMLIPLIGFIILIFWYTRPSDQGANRFG